MEMGLYIMDVLNEFLMCMKNSIFYFHAFQFYQHHICLSFAFLYVKTRIQFLMGRKLSVTLDILLSLMTRLVLRLYIFILGDGWLTLIFLNIFK
jgi:hypothetical protein